ncbi:tyrosine-type recombinase/integrase [Microvirga tunisiensis]|jgi:integrase/recombinase XerD|uniref:tyrosine-type recombinase/integrase n=1 Tax=Microvirga tunisiensis TaxID=2108360 RepID=UPI001FCF0407|nr:tyrosine-type recombinase/integrase [Microvirga tunisiensis]
MRISQRLAQLWLDALATELGASVGTIATYTDDLYARRAALFETLYASGMRIGEALSLPSDAAPSGTRMLLVRGKGDKQRLVPLHEWAIEAVALWQKLAAAYSGGAPSPWLFHPVRHGAKVLTRQAALLEIKEAAVAAGLAHPDRVSPHVLQELLGHAGIETTQI